MRNRVLAAAPGPSAFAGASRAPRMRHYFNWMTGALRQPRVFSPLFFAVGACAYFYKDRLPWSDDPFATYFSLPEKRPGDPFKTFTALPHYPDDKNSREGMIDYWEQALRAQPTSYFPDMFSIAEIMSWTAGTKPSISENSQQNELPVYILASCNSMEAARFPCMDGAVRQLASQFDSGEARYRCLAHPREFWLDPTQGPSEQRTAMFAAIARWVYREECDSLSELKKIPAFARYFDYEYGHLTPLAGKEEEALTFLEQHIDKLRLNVQRVQLDGAHGREAIQLLNAAPALGVFDFELEAGRRTEQGVRTLAKISEVILTPQYKAVAAVAIQEAKRNPDKRIPVSFTRVGGSMFGNDETAISSALSSAYNMLRDSGQRNIDFCLSAFQPEEVEGCATLPFLQGKQLAVITELDGRHAKTLADAATPYTVDAEFDASRFVL